MTDQPTVHACPPSGLTRMPCCGRTPFEALRTDRITTDPDLVTCGKPTHRVLTENEYSAAWHAIEGTAAEEGADPGTVLNAVLRALNIAPPAARPTP